MDVLSLEEVYYNSKGVMKKGVVKLAPTGIGIKVGGDIRTVRSEDIKEIQTYSGVKGQSVRIVNKENKIFVLDSIESGDIENIKEYVKKHYKLNVYGKSLSVEGKAHGVMDVTDAFVEIKDGAKTLFDIPLESIENAYERRGEGIINISNEYQGLAEIRFTSRGEAGKDVHSLIEAIKSHTAGEEHFEVLSLDEVSFVLPRGKCKLTINANSVHIIGKTYHHNILFGNFDRLFYLEKDAGDSAEDMSHVIIEVSTPIRQGQTRYKYILFFVPDDEVMLLPGMGEEGVFYEEEDVEDVREKETLEKIDGLGVGREYKERLSKAITSILSRLSGKKVMETGGFTTIGGRKSLKCSCKANEGFLYPLDEGLLFITKIIYIRYSEIDVVEFSRVNISARTAKTFDARVITKQDKEFTFNGMQKVEFGAFEEYLSQKGVKYVSEVVNEGWAEEGSASEESEEEETMSEGTSTEEEEESEESE